MMTRDEIRGVLNRAYAVTTRRNVEWQDVVALCETARELYDRNEQLKAERDELRERVDG
jgi:hypothetical protein